MDRLRSFGHLRDADLETGRVTAIISTGDVARDDAIIEPGGWDFTNYDRNPVVLFMHNDESLPVARTVEKVATQTELIATAEFDMEDPEAVRLLGKIRRGFVNATSVRWEPKRWEYRKMGDAQREVLVFLEQELLEWSFVTVPADPKALIVRNDGAPLDASAFGRKNDEPLYTPKQLATRDELLDEIDFLRVSLDQYGVASLAKRLDDAGRALALSLYQQIGAVLAIPEEKPAAPRNQGAETLSDELLARLALALGESRRRPSADDVYVRAMAKATGKSEDRVRQEMAAGRV